MRRRIAPAWVRNISGRYWGWLVFKAWVIVWLIVYGCISPAATVVALGVVLWAWIGISVAATLTSMLGMVLAAQPSMRWQRDGPLIEIAGLGVMVFGPLIHVGTLATILVLGLSTSPAVWSPLLQSVVIASAVVARGVEVYPRYRAMHPRKRR